MGDQKTKQEVGGTFKLPSADAMEMRVDDSTRRLGIVSSPSKANHDCSEAAPKHVLSSVKSDFVFLKSTSNTEDSLTEGVSSVEPTHNNNNRCKSCNTVESSVTSSSDSSSKAAIDYHRKLKSLNECVTKWIVMHVSKNPVCDLTPVFKDYEKHLAGIQSVYDKDKINLNKAHCIKVAVPQQKQADVTSPTKPSLKQTGDERAFSSNNSSIASASCSSGLSISGAAGFLSSFELKKTSPLVTTPTFGCGTGRTSPSSAGLPFATHKQLTFGNVAKPNHDKAHEGEETGVPPKQYYKPFSIKDLLTISNFPLTSKNYVQVDGQLCMLEKSDEWFLYGVGEDDAFLKIPIETCLVANVQNGKLVKMLGELIRFDNIICIVAQVLIYF